MKIKNKNIYFFFGGGGGGALGWRSWGCEWRSEAFVKIKKNIYIFFFLGGGRGRGQIKVDVIREKKLL